MSSRQEGVAAVLSHSIYRKASNLIADDQVTIQLACEAIASAYVNIKIRAAGLKMTEEKAQMFADAVLSCEDAVNYHINKFIREQN